MKGVARIFALLLFLVASDVVTHAWVIERNGSSTAARLSLVCAESPKCDHRRSNTRLHAAAAYPNNNDKKSSPLIRRLEMRAVDPSAVPDVGSTVVANSDFVDLNIWQFQSFQLSGIRDYNLQELLKEREQAGQGATLTNLLASAIDKRPAQRLDDPLAEGYIRYVTLTGRSIGSVTMRLSGSYSHGLSSLWILDTIV